jgi:hypothetical protein
MRITRILLAATGGLALALSMSACSSGPSQDFLDAQEGLQGRLANVQRVDAALEEELAKEQANPDYVSMETSSLQLKQDCQALQTQYGMLAGKLDEKDFEGSDLPWDLSTSEDTDCA